MKQSKFTFRSWMLFIGMMALILSTARGTHQQARNSLLKESSPLSTSATTPSRQASPSGYVSSFPLQPTTSSLTSGSPLQPSTSSPTSHFSQKSSIQSLAIEAYQSKKYETAFAAITALLAMNPTDKEAELYASKSLEISKLISKESAVRHLLIAEILAQNEDEMPAYLSERIRDFESCGDWNCLYPSPTPAVPAAPVSVPPFSTVEVPAVEVPATDVPPAPPRVLPLIAVPSSPSRVPSISKDDLLEVPQALPKPASPALKLPAPERAPELPLPSADSLPLSPLPSRETPP